MGVYKIFFKKGILVIFSSRYNMIKNDWKKGGWLNGGN